MFIKYNDTNVHALPYVTMIPRKIRNKRTGKVRTEMKVDTNQSPQDIQWLRPGWNEFPKHIWEQNKENPSVKKMLAEGKIELLSETITVSMGKKKVTKTIGMDDEPVNLKDLSETKSIELVKGTLNRDILQRWLDEETRHKVKRALSKQIEPLLNKTNENDDSE